MDEEVEKLVEKLREGDESAAADLYNRYMNQLVTLAKGRLSAKLGRRIDAEDVVQSALRSFFVHVRQGRYEVHHSGELWGLLARITINKIYQNVERHKAGKRGFDREQSVRQDDNSSVNIVPPTRDPTPDDALALIEEVEQLTAGLDETQLQIVQLRLQGYQIEEIAEQVNRSERTVRRVMDKVKQRLESRLQQQSSAPEEESTDD